MFKGGWKFPWSFPKSYGTAVPVWKSIESITISEEDKDKTEVVKGFNKRKGQYKERLYGKDIKITVEQAVEFLREEIQEARKNLSE